MTPPVFAHGALRLYLLALLEDGPRHGYELIKALSDRFGGTYAPSPGTVYPRLAKLQEEGLVAAEAEGRRSVYRITDAGRAELDARRDEVADVEQDISASVRRLADTLRDELRSSMRGLRADLAASAESARLRAKESARGARGEPWTTPSQRSAGDGATSSAHRNEPSETPPRKPSGEPLSRESQGRLKEAEMLVQAFRDDVRVELRSHAAREPVTDVTVETLRTVLDQARIAVRNSLRG
ncbi:PadR family transcriptional regulator [Sinomonas humi]|uniref:PadR family transcriptional regulator n=1 Tax=Sinomonas humi TaxID=1338436 RepID=A0A0B2AMU5_9MICC|nr:PadR family transcriptional regulator [Sinomonas humi]KHL04971.1 PadR family transcriptional regulator [Sinomonas humi]